MKKYFVFRSDRATEQSRPVNSPEVVACEITRMVFTNHWSVEHCTACEEGSPEAVMYGLQNPALYTVCLDDERIAIWREKVQPVVVLLDSMVEAINDAYGVMSNSLTELRDACENHELFADLQLGEDIDVSRGFSYMDPPSLGEFHEQVCDMFDVVELGAVIRV